jgi:exonuclease VII large subunit
MSLPEPCDRSTFKQSNSHHSIDPSLVPSETLDTQQVCDWQGQLLPVGMLMSEEDVTVLRQQLEAAHQLLHYRQNLVDSLTEQLISDQTHLAQMERDLKDAKQQCARQSDKVEDVQSVCQDLRSQLRRQQQRIGEYKQILKQSGNLPRPARQLAAQQGFVSLDYDSLGGAPVGEGAAKAAPVAAWSAEAADLAGPLAIYRKLAEMTMATAAAHAQQKVSQNRAKPQTFDAENYRLGAGHRIELPSFT